MSTNYSGDKIINRQRVCVKCHGFVTHDKVSDDEIGCALCGNRVQNSPVLSRRVSAKIIAEIVDNQQREHEERMREKEKMSTPSELGKPKSS